MSALADLQTPALLLERANPISARELGGPDDVELEDVRLGRVGVEPLDVQLVTLVGRVGNSGCSLGSHLHFGIRRDGAFVDPLRYLPRR